MNFTSASFCSSRATVGDPASSIIKVCFYLQALNELNMATSFTFMDRFIIYGHFCPELYQYNLGKIYHFMDLFSLYYTVVISMEYLSDLVELRYLNKVTRLVRLVVIVSL